MEQKKNIYVLIWLPTDFSDSTGNCAKGATCLRRMWTSTGKQTLAWHVATLYTCVPHVTNSYSESGFRTASQSRWHTLWSSPRGFPRPTGHSCDDRLPTAQLHTIANETLECTDMTRRNSPGDREERANAAGCVAQLSSWRQRRSSREVGF